MKRSDDELGVAEKSETMEEKKRNTGTKQGENSINQMRKEELSSGEIRQNCLRQNSRVEWECRIQNADCRFQTEMNSK